MAQIWNGESYVDDGITQTPQYWNGSSYVDDNSAGARYLMGATGQYQNAPKTRDWVNSLLSGGMTTSDLDAALKSYMGSTGASESDKGWWGDQALLRAFGTGLDATGKTSNWRSVYDPMGESAQQKELAVNHDTTQAKQGGDFDDLGDILKGVGLVTGLGGLANAFGAGIGLPGVDVVGSDWASGLSSAMNPGSAAGGIADAVGNFVPAEAAGGTVTGSGGGNVDWLDSILGDTGSDWANGVTDLGNNGVSLPDGLNWDIPPGGDAGGSVSLPDGLNFDTPPSGVNTLTPPTGSTTQVLMQQAVDAGIPFDIASKLGTPGLTQLLNLAKGAAGGTAAAGKGSAISRIFGGTGTADDWTSLLGNLGTGALSALSANKYADNMKELADRSWNAGSDYRNRLASTYTNPGAYLDSPEVKAITDRSTNALARSLSARDGNPIGSGRALNEINDYAGQTMLGQLGNYRQQLANFGGQSQLSGNYSQLGSQSADAGSNIYNSLANTVSRVTQPQTDWASIMKQFGLTNSPV